LVPRENIESFVRDFDFFPYPLTVTDTEGRVIAGNRAFEDIGVESFPHEFFKLENSAEWETGGTRYRIYFRSKNFEDQQFILVLLVPLDPGMIPMEELTELLNASSDGIVVSDEKGTILSINRAYEELIGVKAEDFIGQPVEELVRRGYLEDLVTPKVLREKRKVSMFREVRGKEILFTGSPVFGPDGKIKRVIANVRDLTALNSLRRQLAEAEEREKRYSQALAELQFQLSGKDLIVASEAMRKTVSIALRAASSDCPVLITGETGTGKELLAALIHRHSERRTKPFIVVNCGALPASLAESELFGYTGGAFTGARSSGKPGLFELANEGTIFLDEIGDLDPSIQVKVLRVIQEGEFYRLGSREPTKVNVRVIAATNKDLQNMVQRGAFREDLYYRLNVVSIVVPPLRSRREDIPALTDYFLKKFNEKYNCQKEISPRALAYFFSYNWPGNVRELQNVVERLVLLTEGQRIEGEMVERILFDIQQESKNGKEERLALKGIIEDVEKKTIIQAYKELGSTRKVAKALGIHQSTVVRKLKKYKEGVPGQ